MIPASTHAPRGPGSARMRDTFTIMSDSEFEPAKLRAADTAAKMVEAGMIVGLGSGTTATAMVQSLGERVAEEGLRFIGVATSGATATLARALGIELRDLDEVDALDLNLDGA